MEQVLIAGYYDDLPTGAVEFCTPTATFTWNPEANRTQIIPTPGKLKHLRVECQNAPGAGKSYTFTLRLNGADTALTCTVANLATSCQDSVNEVTVAAGDEVSFEVTPAGTPTMGRARWTMVFEGDNAKESVILGTNYGNSGQIRYFQCSHGELGSTATEDDVRQICPTPGKIKNLYVELNQSPGTAPDAYRFTLRVNGISTALTCTITAPGTTCNDVVNEVTVAAGDRLTLMCEPLDGPANNVYVWYGMCFVADTDGESINLGGTSDDLSSTETEVTWPKPGYYTVQWIALANEAWVYQLAQECTAKKLYIHLSGSPGAGNSYAFTLRRNGADTALTCTISDAAISCNDVVNSVAIADDDELTLKVVPTGGPTIRDAYWGFVLFRQPPAFGAGSFSGGAARLLM